MSAFEIEREAAATTRIKVIGVGGGGTNAVDYMISAEIKNVEFCVVNTDSRALARSACPVKIHIGEELTHGLGAGGNPDLGRQSAEASSEELAAALENTDMLFISAGMGGGTGTGATPVLARIAHELGILTVAIVTKPFRFEGLQRVRKAEAGLKRLEEYVDTLIVISNDRLLEVVGRKTSLVDAFGVVNNILGQSVRSIANLISTPGLINVDFADIRSVMSQKGAAVMGVSTSKGENRATEAVKKACSSALLDRTAIDGARGVLVCITGGSDMTLYEIDEAMSMIYESVDENADVIFGAVIDPSVGDELQVTLIATGFGVAAEPAVTLAQQSRPAPTELRSVDMRTAEPPDSWLRSAPPTYAGGALAGGDEPAAGAAAAPAKFDELPTRLEPEAPAQFDELPTRLEPPAPPSLQSLKEKLSSMIGGGRDSGGPAAGPYAGGSNHPDFGRDVDELAPPAAADVTRQRSAAAPDAAAAADAGAPEYEDEADTPAFLRRRRSRE